MSICLIGNYNIDQLLGPLDALPGWGQEFIASQMTVRTGGAVGNTALALAALGVSPFCVGNLGDDAYGEMIRRDLVRSGADVTGLVTTPGTLTCVGVTLVRRDGERAFVTYLGHLEAFDHTLLEAYDAIIGRAHYVLFAGYFLFPGLQPAELQAALAQWRHRGQKVAFDTGWDPQNWPAAQVKEITTLLRDVDIFLPNYEEGAALTGTRDLGEILDRLRACGPELVVLKLGPEGAIARNKDETVKVEGYPVQVVDTCGAGDVLNAGILYGLSQQWPLAKCLAFANAQAALAISRVVSRYPAISEIQTILRSKM